MDNNTDAAVGRIIDRAERERSAQPCDDFEPSSREIPLLCANCGWGHRYSYYELAPGASRDPKHKFLAVDSVDGSTEYIEALPKGAEVVEPEGGTA